MEHGEAANSTRKVKGVKSVVNRPAIRLPNSSEPPRFRPTSSPMKYSLRSLMIVVTPAVVAKFHAGLAFSSSGSESYTAHTFPHSHL